DRAEMRKFGFDLAVHLTTWGVTAFLVGEYSEEDIQHEPIFAIADSILHLHYQTHGLHSQRFIEAAKVRGSDYFGGLHPYVTSDDGLKVYPRMKTPHVFAEAPQSGERVASGLPELDKMMWGGL